jgi:hypothetical protein
VHYKHASFLDVLESEWQSMRGALESAALFLEVSEELLDTKL